MSASRVCSSYFRPRSFLAPSTSRPVELASNATSSADMYFVIAGTTSARAAASRRSLALAIAFSTRSPPKIVANTSGTSTIARTFDPTGQLLGAQARGRFAGLVGAGAAGHLCHRVDRRARTCRAGKHGHRTSPAGLTARTTAALSFGARENERLIKLPALFLPYPPAGREQCRTRPGNPASMTARGGSRAIHPHPPYRRGGVLRTRRRTE